MENARRRSARNGWSRYRACVSVREIRDTESLAQMRDREWRDGCRWAGFALAATFGPMLALGILWGW